MTTQDPLLSKTAVLEAIKDLALAAGPCGLPSSLIEVDRMREAINALPPTVGVDREAAIAALEMLRVKFDAIKSPNTMLNLSIEAIRALPHVTAQGEVERLRGALEKINARLNAPDNTATIEQYAALLSSVCVEINDIAEAALHQEPKDTDHAE